MDTKKNQKNQTGKPEQKIKNKNKSYLVEVVATNKYLVEVVAASCDDARKIAKTIPAEELLGKESVSTRETERVWCANS